MTMATMKVSSSLVCFWLKLQEWDATLSFAAKEGEGIGEASQKKVQQCFENVFGACDRLSEGEKKIFISEIEFLKRIKAAAIFDCTVITIMQIAHKRFKESLSKYEFRLDNILFNFEKARSYLAFEYRNPEEIANYMNLFKVLPLDVQLDIFEKFWKVAAQMTISLANPKHLAKLYLHLKLNPGHHPFLEKLSKEDPNFSATFKNFVTQEQLSQIANNAVQLCFYLFGPNSTILCDLYEIYKNFPSDEMEKKASLQAAIERLIKEDRVKEAFLLVRLFFDIEKIQNIAQLNNVLHPIINAALKEPYDLVRQILNLPYSFPEETLLGLVVMFFIKNSDFEGALKYAKSLKGQQNRFVLIFELVLASIPENVDKLESILNNIGEQNEFNNKFYSYILHMIKALMDHFKKDGYPILSKVLKLKLFETFYMEIFSSEFFKDTGFVKEFYKHLDANSTALKYALARKIPDKNFALKIATEMNDKDLLKVIQIELFVEVLKNDKIGQAISMLAIFIDDQDLLKYYTKCIKYKEGTCKFEELEKLHKFLHHKGDRVVSPFCFKTPEKKEAKSAGA